MLFQDEALYKCHLLLIDDPALKLSRGLMWIWLSLSSAESDGVNRSICTELFCIDVYISQTVHTEANYHYPALLAARSKRPQWTGPWPHGLYTEESWKYVATLYLHVIRLTSVLRALCHGTRLRWFASVLSWSISQEIWGAWRTTSLSELFQNLETTDATMPVQQPTGGRSSCCWSHYTSGCQSGGVPSSSGSAPWGPLQHKRSNTPGPCASSHQNISRKVTEAWKGVPHHHRAV